MIAKLALLAAIPPAWFGVLVPAANSPVVHYTDLAWESPSTNPPGTVFNIYKAPGACAAASGYQKIASDLGSGPTGLTYRDYAVTVGQTVCYYVTSAYGGVESGPSPKAEATTPTTLKE